MARQSFDFIERFWSCKTLSDAYSIVAQHRSSPEAAIFEAGYNELQKINSLRNRSEDMASQETLEMQLATMDNLKRAMEKACSQELGAMEKGLAFLATAGIRGSASLSAVAPGISEALVATAAGLLVAIPSVIFYNHFSNKNRLRKGRGMYTLKKGKGHRRGRSLVSEINVTPMVDVMLVLLIIFMVTAPMMTQGLDIDLPETTTKSLRQQEDPIVVSIDKDGIITLRDIVVTKPLLRQQLAKLPDEMKEGPIYLKADKTVPYGVVVSVMADIKGTGFDKLGMITQPPQDIEK
ncbi:unnamed protein product [Cyprideis torosa]|uniref:Uncharacterized protein n=1 Tax=Cyprideis torosa TaxID=163714 RepID=A0A7R8WPX7_9CRUS|nr:unnamed protein product [Cyprideis torosa]CAG0902349.1 unnamed protein product [Cyprideis torosa]